MIGFFDESRVYQIRQAAYNQLVALSANYRTVAIGYGMTKNTLRRLCFQLAERDNSRLQLVFDAVYMLRRQNRHRPNITHTLLDFYDEQYELGEWSCKNVVIL